MDLQVSERELFLEAQEMALHLRLLEKHAARLPARVRAEVADRARQAADDLDAARLTGTLDDDTAQLDPHTLRWFADLLQDGPADG